MIEKHKTVIHKVAEGVYASNPKDQTKIFDELINDKLKEGWIIINAIVNCKINHRFSSIQFSIKPFSYFH